MENRENREERREEKERKNERKIEKKRERQRKSERKKEKEKYRMFLVGWFMRSKSLKSKGSDWFFGRCGHVYTWREGSRILVTARLRTK